jgi:hypothetical protein
MKTIQEIEQGVHQRPQDGFATFRIQLAKE